VRPGTQAMSQENVEIVKRWIDALNSDDKDGFLDSCRDDCLFFSVTGSTIGGTPYSGRDGLRKYWADKTAAWTELRIDVERIVEGDEGAILGIGRITGLGRGSGVQVEQRVGLVCRMRDGKLAYLHSYLDPAEALKAVGLEE
jgi:ketosteroid isomerase-like protein